VTEALAEALAREQITKVQLAQRLGKTKGWVSQVFAGGKNLTLRTVADVADALGHRIRVFACKEARSFKYQTTLDDFEATNAAQPFQLAGQMPSFSAVGGEEAA
jgi:transcriptional regulator with XRE-family HTH domain